MTVKVVLQEAFETWGLPLRMRFDNGVPWGTNSRVPSALALWLAGLGIAVLFGRPARSTDNALVERCHGVLDQWVDPQHCADFEACQNCLEWAAETQRERYRSPHHLSRAAAYPEMYENRRTYRRGNEPQRWSLEAAAAFLSGYQFERKVEKNGRITLLAASYSVGRKYARQQVYVQLDPRRLEWVVKDAFGQILVRHVSQELDYAKISQFKLAKRCKD